MLTKHYHIPIVVSVVPILYSDCACDCRPEVEKILRALPSKTTRQTLLFSATFPEDIQELSQFALRPNFNLVDTVGEDSTHSSAQVSQPMLSNISTCWSVG